MDTKTIILVKGKETKGTQVYNEEGDNPILRSVYLPKGYVGSNPPSKIEVTIKEV